MEEITATAPHRLARRVAGQRWSDVLFLHWRVAPDVMAPLLPAGTVPDEHGGGTWAGLIAFRLSEATLGPIGPLAAWPSSRASKSVTVSAILR